MPRTFFSSDVGLRYLQIQELVAQKGSTFAIRYPGRTVDPALAHVPYYYAYSVIDDQIHFNISPFFPWLTAFLVQHFGDIGLSLLPALSSVAAALALYQLARLSGFSYAPLAFLVALFGTPLLFYGVVLWDHSLGSALAMWAVVGVATGMTNKGRYGYLLGGIAAGLAVGQRPELYLFGVALGLGLLIEREVRWPSFGLFTLGGLTGAVPVWWLQWQWVGHPLGMALAPHLLGYGTPDTFPVTSRSIPWFTKATRFLIHAEPSAPEMRWAIATIIAGALLISGSLALTHKIKRERFFPISFGIGVIILSGGYLLLAWIARNSALIGIVATLPLFPLIVLQLRPTAASSVGPIYRLVLWTGIGFTLGMLVTWPGYGGLQWGARYLLPLYLLLVYLAWYGYHFHHENLATVWHQGLHRCVGILLALSLVIQGMGLYRIFVDHPKHGIIRRHLLAVPVEHLLTNHVFMPSFMTSVTPEKSFLYVRNEAERDQLLEHLLAQGIDQVGMIPRSRRSFPEVPQIDGYLTTVESLPGEFLIYQIYQFRPEEANE